MILPLYLLIGLLVAILATHDGDLGEGGSKFFVVALLVLLWFPIAVACAAWRLMDQ